MLKNILNLDGAQQLSNNEQKEINGGIPRGCVQAWLNEDGTTCGSGYYLLMTSGRAYCCPL